MKYIAVGFGDSASIQIFPEKWLHSGGSWVTRKLFPLNELRDRGAFIVIVSRLRRDV